MLTINQLTGFAGQGKHAQASFIANNTNILLPIGTYNSTFSSENLGPASPNRLIAVCIAAQQLSTTTASIGINSVTIGGISAQIVANDSVYTGIGGAGNAAASCIAYIENSLLTSGDIVVNYTAAITGSNSGNRITIGIYNINNQNNVTPYDNQIDSHINTGTSFSYNIDVPLLGCVLGAASSARNTSTMSFTNLTDTVNDGQGSLIGHNNVASIGALSVTINNTATILAATLSLASWQ